MLRENLDHLFQPGETRLSATGVQYLPHQSVHVPQGWNPTDAKAVDTWFGGTGLLPQGSRVWTVSQKQVGRIFAVALDGDDEAQCYILSYDDMQNHPNGRPVPFGGNAPWIPVDELNRNDVRTGASAITGQSQTTGAEVDEALVGDLVTVAEALEIVRDMMEPPQDVAAQVEALCKRLEEDPGDTEAAAELRRLTATSGDLEN